MKAPRQTGAVIHVEKTHHGRSDTPETAVVQAEDQCDPWVRVKEPSDRARPMNALGNRPFPDQRGSAIRKQVMADFTPFRQVC
jgi:hypothetical protein